MRLLTLTLICLGPAGVGIAACQDAPAPSVEVSDAVCRPTPNGRDLTGCYMTLTATTDDKLVSVATPVASEAQVHEVSTDGGVMAMAEMADGLLLPAGQAVSLKPGGNHIMLMQVSHPLAEGDTIDLALTFDRAGAMTVTAQVGNPAVY
jgi:periplasmic copper chaperone A